MIGRELRPIIQNKELCKEHENASGGSHIWIDTVIQNLHADAPAQRITIHREPKWSEESHTLDDIEKL